MTEKHFASCDWGTSRFRLSLVDVSNGSRIASYESEDGVRSFAAPIEFSNFLTERLADLEASARVEPCREIWVSGMASSSIGWKEIPYAALPFKLDGTDCRTETIRHGERNVHLVSGIASDRDILRGEETQILGALADRDTERVLLLLPGTHSKHVQVDDGVCADFTTFMTGELFDLMTRESILAHSTNCDTSEDLPIGPFREGVEASVDGAARHFFGVRVRSVLNDLPPLDNRAFLSGLLIGEELRRSPELDSRSDRRVVLAASGTIARAYAEALRCLDINFELIDRADELTVWGHRLLAATQKSK